MSDAAQQFSPLFLKANIDLDEQPGLILLIQSTDRAEKRAHHLLENSLLNSYMQGRAGSKTKSLESACLVEQEPD